MADPKYDVIVVGAGPGGSACAALLAKWGMKTLLLEKNDRVGGKAMSITRGGFTYELWNVIAMPRPDSRFTAVLNELGMECPAPDMMAGMEAGEGGGLGGGFQYRLPSGEYVPFTLMPPLMIPEILTGEETEEVNRLYNDMDAMTPQELDALDEISFHDFLSRYRIPQSAYAYLAVLANILFVEPIDLLSASEGVKTIRDMSRSVLSGGSQMYFKGGFGRLFETYAEGVKRYGGEVRLRTRVERITVEDGQVRGVVTDKDTFQAPIVVSDAGIQPTVLKLVGEGHFDKGYVNYIKDLVPSLGLMGSRYFLSKRVLNSSAYIVYSDESWWNMERYLRATAGQIPDDMLTIVFVPSVFDSTLAPEGKQCALTATLCPADPKMKDLKRWWDKLDEMVANIWPELPQYIERREDYSTADVSAVTRDHVVPGQGGECIGLGQVVGQCGRYKPSAKAPLRGLFYVGSDAGGYGCGTQQAVDSAINVAHMVLQYHQTHF